MSSPDFKKIKIGLIKIVQSTINIATLHYGRDG